MGLKVPFNVWPYTVTMLDTKNYACLQKFNTINGKGRGYWIEVSMVIMHNGLKNVGIISRNTIEDVSSLKMNDEIMFSM